MKVCVSSKVLCISLILLVGNKSAVTGDDLDPLRTLLAGPIASAVPGLAGNAIHFFALVLSKSAANQATPNDILQGVNNVQASVDRIEKLIKIQQELIPERSRNLTQIETSAKEITDLVDFIQTQFEEMQSDRINKGLLLTDAKTSTDGHINVLSQLKKLMKELNSPHRGTSALHKYYEEIARKIRNGAWCGSGVSLNEYFYEEFKYVMTAVMQGFAVLLESYRIIAEDDHDWATYNTKTEELRQLYNNFKAEFSEQIGALMAKSSVAIRRCDPWEHKRGDNFLEFEKLIQGHLVHLEHLGAGQCENVAAEPSYHKNEFSLPSVLDTQWCNGKIFSCRSTAATDLCPATSPSRRFDGVFALKPFVYKEWPNLGNVSVCEQKTALAFSPCGCLCDDWNDPASFRSIDLNPAFSDYRENKVITGMKFVNQSNILRIEIQQGKLENFGAINATSVRWLTRPEGIAPITRPFGLNKDRRSINLNTVTIPADMAMIGVGFDYVDDLIQLKVYAAPISYDAGLVQKDLKEYPVYRPQKPRVELKIDAPTVPSLAYVNARIDGQNKFVKLQPSDWTKDAAQTLVPFLDLQEVATNPPSLLGGAGFAYRSAPGYGGFLSLEINSLDYTKRVLDFGKSHRTFP